MPNLYATLAEIRDVAPDGLASGTTQYDKQFIRLSETISRLIDGMCGREFYPVSEIRYFYGTGTRDVYIDDLVSVTEIAYSLDDGDNYTALSASDYNLMAGANYNPRGTYNHIELSQNGDLATWPEGQKAVKITGVWGKTDLLDDAWEDVGDDVADNPLAADAATLTVTDVDGAGPWGQTPRISAGHILKMESEYVEVTTTNTTTQAATIVRARNGTTAAEHAQNTDIYRWRVHPKVKQACIIQALRQFKRGQAGFHDAEAMPDMKKIMHIKALDQEVIELLADLTRIM